MDEPDRFFYRFGPFSLDPSTKSLRCDDSNTGSRYVKLNASKEFDTLLFLIEQRGQLVTKNELWDKFWPSEQQESNIPQTISKVREALGDDSKNPTYIKTIPKKGYSFIAEVERVQGEPKSCPVIVDGDDPAPEQPHEENLDAEASPPIDPERSWPAHHTVEDSGFESWIGHDGKIRTWLICIFVILALGLSAAGHFEGIVVPIVSSIQLVIAFIFFFSPRGSEEFRLSEAGSEKKVREACGYYSDEEWEEAKDYAKGALEQYTTYWKVLLLCWILLYAVLCIMGFLNLPDVESKIPSYDIIIVIFTAFSTLFNNLSSLALALCYFVLNKPTVSRDENRNISKKAPLMDGIALVGFVAIVENLLLIITSLQGNGMWRIEGSSLPVVQAVGAWISGFACAITMALYVGRLQSKFLSARTWLFIALYSYTAIQPLYFLLIEKHQIWAAIILNSAFVLKCLLYLYMSWLFKTGRILFYFVRVRRIYDNVNEEWREFQSIV